MARVSVRTPGEASPASGARKLWFGAALVCGYAAATAAVFKASRYGPDALIVLPEAMAADSAPSWLPSAEVTRINALSAGVRGKSILSPDLTEELAACYLQSPWVGRVVYVRRRHPNRLDVALLIRRPAAVVERPSGPPAVLDAEAVRLPASADPSRLPRLKGVRSVPPAPGEVWSDVRVLDGMRVLKKYGALVAKNTELRPFRPVEVNVSGWSRADRRPVVVIRTASGFPICWGVDLPEEVARIVGPTSSEKVARLAEVLPSLSDRAERVAYISLRQSSGVVYRMRD